MQGKYNIVDYTPRKLSVADVMYNIHDQDDDDEIEAAVSCHKEI